MAPPSFSDGMILNDSVGFATGVPVATLRFEGKSTEVCCNAMDRDPTSSSIALRWRFPKIWVPRYRPPKIPPPEGYPPNWEKPPLTANRLRAYVLGASNIEA